MCEGCGKCGCQKKGILTEPNKLEPVGSGVADETILSELRQNDRDFFCLIEDRTSYFPGNPGNL